MNYSTGKRQLIIPLDEYLLTYQKALEACDAAKPEFDQYNEQAAALYLREAVNSRREYYNIQWLRAYGALLTEDQIRSSAPLTNSGWRKLARSMPGYEPYAFWEYRNTSLMAQLRKSYDPGRYTSQSPESEARFILDQQSKITDVSYSSREWHLLRGKILKRLDQFNSFEGSIAMDEEAMAEFKQMKADGYKRAIDNALSEWKRRSTAKVPDLMPLLQDIYAEIPNQIPEPPSDPIRRIPRKDAGHSTVPFVAALTTAGIILLGYLIVKLF